MGVGLYSWRDTKQDGGLKFCAHQSFETINLIFRVDDDKPHTCFERQENFSFRLIVSMKNDLISLRPSSERAVKFACCRNIKTHALFERYACHCSAEKCLRCIGHTRAIRANRFSTTNAQVLFVIDEQRRSILFGQCDDVTSSKNQMTI